MKIITPIKVVKMVLVMTPVTNEAELSTKLLFKLILLRVLALQVDANIEEADANTLVRMD